MRLMIKHDLKNETEVTHIQKKFRLTGVLRLKGQLQWYSTKKIVSIAQLNIWISWLINN